MRIWNAIVLVAVLALNGLAGSGALSGRSIGEIANAHPTYFLPAGWVFAIWSLIYVGLVAFVAVQFHPVGREAGVARAVGWAWVVNGMLNVGWLVTFSYERFFWAWILMVVLLASLVWISERIRSLPRTLALRWTVHLPFQVYFAWIAVATIANTAQLLEVAGFSGFGITGPAWSVALVIVATGLATFIVLSRRDVVFPLVVAWALIGIGARFSDTSLVQGATLAGTVVCLGLTLVPMIRGKPGTRASAAESHASISASDGSISASDASPSDSRDPISDRRYSARDEPR